MEQSKQDVQVLELLNRRYLAGLRYRKLELLSSNQFEVIIGNLDDEDFVITLSCTTGIPDYNKLSESIHTNEALSSTPLPNDQAPFEQMLGTQYLVHVANVAELYVLLVVIEDLLTEMMEEKEH